MTWYEFVIVKHRQHEIHCSTYEQPCSPGLPGIILSKCATISTRSSALCYSEIEMQETGQKWDILKYKLK